MDRWMALLYTLHGFSILYRDVGRGMGVPGVLL